MLNPVPVDPLPLQNPSAGGKSPEERNLVDETRKLRKAGSAETIFDALTILLLNQELLLGCHVGPLNNGQKAILRDMAKRSKEIARHLRLLLSG